MLVEHRNHAAEASGHPQEQDARGQQDTPQLQLRLYSAWDELADLTTAWERLLQHSVGPTIFSTPEWLGAWWRAYGQGKQLLTLAFADASGELVGLAPLYREELSSGLRRLRLVGDGSEDSDNLDLLFRSGYEARGTAALLDWLATQPGWDLCELNTLPADSPNVHRLLTDLQSRKWAHSVSQHPRFVLTLPESWESYLGRLPKDRARNIEYRRRRIYRRFAARILRCTSVEELDTYLAALFALHQKRWAAQGDDGTFALLERRQFYADMGRAFLRRGWLEFWLLELEGQIAAAEFTFRYGDTAFGLQSGRDPAHRSEGLGTVMKAHIIERFIAGGVHRLDFLSGDEPHKLQWGVDPASNTDVHFVARPFSRAHFYMRARQGAVCAHAAAHVAGQWLRARSPSAYAFLSDTYRRYRRLRGMQ